MAPRIPIVDSDNPILPESVRTASIGTTTGMFADGGTVATVQATAESAASAARAHGVSAASIPGIDITGATDCSGVINAYIADLDDDVRELVFPPGTYMAFIRVTKPNLRLSGSWGATIKTPDDATEKVNDTAIYVLADGVTIDGLQIDGNNTGNPFIDSDFNRSSHADGVGIYASDATVQNCYIHNTCGHGIIAWDMAYTPGGIARGQRRGIRITGNRVEGGNNRAAVDIASLESGIDSNRDVIIAENHISNTYLVLHTADDVVIANNVCLAGISCHSGINRVTIVGNRSHGILVQTGTDIAITGNTVDPVPESDSIRMMGVNGGIISGNLVTDPVGHGIRVGEDCDNVAVTGNTVTGTVLNGHGIWIRAGSGFTVVGNCLSALTSTGTGERIHIDSGVTDLAVVGNVGAAEHDTYYPWMVDLALPISTPARFSGFNTITADSGCILGAYLASAAANASYAEWDVVLGAGTWDMVITHLTNAAYGIGTVKLDGTTVGTFDAYAATFTRNVRSIIEDIAIATPGRHVLRIENPTKNASSSAYSLLLNAIRFIRTA